MNSTATALPRLDKKDAQNLGVPRPKGGWKLSDRWAWAIGLPVGGIARSVAGVIAYHARDSTGLSWPGMATIERESGFGRTAIIAAIKALESGGHLTVRRFRVGKRCAVNRYQLPPMGNVSDLHPSAPDAPAPSAPDGLEQVRTEQVRTHSAPRLTCELHDRSWYQRDGESCFECAKARARARPAGYQIPPSVARQMAGRSRAAWS